MAKATAENVTVRTEPKLTTDQKLNLILDQQEALLENDRLILAHLEDIVEKLNDINEGRDYDTY